MTFGRTGHPTCLDVASEQREASPSLLSRKPLQRSDFFPSALEMLSIEGPAGLTVSALCTRLCVSKGSFYHHFDDWTAFQLELESFWQRYCLARLSRIQTVDSRCERLELALNSFARWPNRAAAAMRDGVPRGSRRTCGRVDAALQDVLTECAFMFVADVARSSMVGRQGLCLLVGLQHSAAGSDLQTHLTTTTGWAATWLPVEAEVVAYRDGYRAQVRELSENLAQHGKREGHATVATAGPRGAN